MIKNIEKSLVDMLGDKYCEAICEAASFLGIKSSKGAQEIAHKRISFMDKESVEKQHLLAQYIGSQVTDEFINDMDGAPTNAFRKATITNMSPIGGMGSFRIGEDGRVYLAAKSEHYHTPLGHNFAGYGLIDVAKSLGITNATHNNTRGYVTRLLERELIRTANGIEKDDPASLRHVLESKEKHVLNRVINLETGSLAVEAGIKMMLARFYRLHSSHLKPKFNGKTPVILVLADNEGGLEANYHGTTIADQMMRGMWPEIYSHMEKSGALKIVGVKINDIGDFKNKIEKFNKEGYKTAGFMHEIILMNYGGIRLNKGYLQEAYRLCEEYDTLTLADEIQSCMWYDGMYLFREYELNPDFVILGKGFPGGQYPASRILTTYEADNLDQFGALVTNGQEELASLAYLITMEFATANGENTEKMGKYLEKKLYELKNKSAGRISAIEGKGHLAALHFKTIGEADKFAKKVNGMCVDISAQTYKPHCPPAVLLKPPIITDAKIIDAMMEKMNLAISTEG